MKKQFLPYKLAAKLRDLGFDEECLATIDETEYLHIKGMKNLPRGAMCYDTISCPLWQQAFDWFREEHGLHTYHVICDMDKIYYKFIIHEHWTQEDFLFYEEARQACLEKLIEIKENEKTTI